MNLITESWRGQRPLGVVFWGYYVGFSIAYAMVLAYVVGAAPEPVNMIVAIPGLLFLLPYTVWVLVSIWQCSRNSNRFWRVLARAWIIIVLIGTAGQIAAMSITSYQDYSERPGQIK